VARGQQICVTIHDRADASSVKGAFREFFYLRVTKLQAGQSRSAFDDVAAALCHIEAHLAAAVACQWWRRFGWSEALPASAAMMSGGKGGSHNETINVSNPMGEENHKGTSAVGSEQDFHRR